MFAVGGFGWMRRVRNVVGLRSDMWNVGLRIRCAVGIISEEE
jgi:hypothetical protein